jgi:adenylosuccinate synthase
VFGDEQAISYGDQSRDGAWGGGVSTPLRIVVLSGQVATGKSTLATLLANRFGGRVVSTKDLMREIASDRGDVLPDERRAMQQYGRRLDEESSGQWVARAAGLVLEGDASLRLMIVDSVRLLAQVEYLRLAFGSDIRHVHLRAPHDVLSDRYARRGDASGLAELSSFDEVLRDATESAVPELAGDADVIVKTERCSPEDVLTRVTAHLELHASRNHQLVDILVGGQYGSEGKGNVAFYLADEYGLLVRVGGPNAGHKVPLPTPFTHRLLPSGTMANPDAKLLVGPGATLDIDVLMKEVADCAVEMGRLFIDPQAMIIEKEDVSAETDLVTSIGSTGKGGGSAAGRRIMGRNAASTEVPVRLARDLKELRPYIRPAAEILEDAYRRGDRILLEGTQGTALSLYHGSYPHVTSRDTTAAGCLAEAGIGPHRVRRVVMVTRVYPIRVQSPTGGDSGPMSREISLETIAKRSNVDLDDLIRTEKGSVSNNQRRIGEFDWQLLRRASELNGATDIALTFADYIDARNRQARRYDQLTPETILFIEEIERVAGVPVSLIGTRFDVRSIIDRRRW